jgi:hypothetical protein
VGRRFEAGEIDQIGDQSDFPFARPILERALATTNEWSVFDFRRLREFADRHPELDPRLSRLILGFDVAVVIPEATAATQIP